MHVSSRTPSISCMVRIDEKLHVVEMLFNRINFTQ